MPTTNSPEHLSSQSLAPTQINAKVKNGFKQGIKAALATLLLTSAPMANAVDWLFDSKFTGTLRLDYANVNDDRSFSFVNGGIGLLRYDERFDDNKWHIGQANFNYGLDITSTLSAHVDTHFYDDLDHNPNVSQAFLRYAPLSRSGYRWRVRAGFMYPHLSLENTRPGWLSNYSISNSAINSWIGEELRTTGVEVSFTRPGRRFRSPWTWNITASTFKGNDPLSSTLAWRGWGLHDRQTGLNERLPIGNYPGLDGPVLSRQTRQIDLFDEIDGRWGFYGSAKVRYASRWELQWFHFDTNGDPETFSEGQWTWDTVFDQLAARYNINRNWSLRGQFMTGDSLAGRNLVNIDFESWYLMLHFKKGKHLATVRFDDFETRDNDQTPLDDNNGDGDAWTLYYGYQYNPAVRFSLEWISTDSTRPNRYAVYQTPHLTQRRIIGAVSYSW